MLFTRVNVGPGAAQFALGLAFFLGAGRTMPAQAPVRVLTFNIRYGTANDGAHRWPNRSTHVMTTIRDHAPHLLGIQEALRFQLDEIARAVPGYRELGVGRDDGKTAGEYAALLVDTARFGIVASGYFWYSDTPDVPGSKSWGNNVTRICTWARLVDRATGDTIRVYNSHWDHESQPSREKSAALLKQHVNADASPADRVIVMADFNSGETNPAFGILTDEAPLRLHDTYRDVHPNERIVGTFHAFKGDSTADKIDAILVSRGWMTVDAGIDRRRFGELWASDHFAVSAIIRRTSPQ
jgi:endonuclease/exonuclease/phosphatase family metal-dependent hydrolase